VDLCQNLRVLHATDHIDEYALQLVRVDRKLLGRDIEALPELGDFFRNALRAAGVDPLQLAHWAFKPSNLKELLPHHRVGVIRTVHDFDFFLIFANLLRVCVSYIDVELHLGVDVQFVDW